MASVISKDIIIIYCPWNMSTDFTVKKAAYNQNVFCLYGRSRMKWHSLHFVLALYGPIQLHNFHSSIS